MNKKIMVFGASNSKHSINKQFAIYVANQLSGVDLNIVDLNDYPLPVYSKDLEKQSGIPDNAKKFEYQIEDCQAIVASFAEYNGLYTSAFKNLWDWLSRLGSFNIWKDKPMFLLSTSPSKRTTNYVMKVSKELFPKIGAQVIADFYLPTFDSLFKDGDIIDEGYKKSFNERKELFQAFIDNLN